MNHFTVAHIIFMQLFKNYVNVFNICTEVHIRELIQEKGKKKEQVL